MIDRLLLVCIVLVLAHGASAQQYARPDGDEDNSTYYWNTPGQNNAHWSDIDEVTPDGVAEIVEDAGKTVRMTLSNVTDPAVGTGHILRCYAYRSSNKANTFTMDVYESGTLRSSHGGVEVTNGTPAAAFTETLSEGEANAITNYDNLELYLTATATSPTDIFVDQCEFQVPAAAGGSRRVIVISAIENLKQLFRSFWTVQVGAAR